MAFNVIIKSGYFFIERTDILFEVGFREKVCNKLHICVIACLTVYRLDCT